MNAPTELKTATRYCVDCKHHQSVGAVTGGGTTSHQCTAVVDPVTGIRLRQQCSEVRVFYGGECGKEGRLFEPKEPK